MSSLSHAGGAGQLWDLHPCLEGCHLPCLTLAQRVIEAISE